MKKYFIILFALLFVFIFCSSSLGAQEDLLAQANQLLEKEGLQNFKQAVDLYEKVLKQDPNNFEANWKAAEACREYGFAAEKLDLPDWKEICKDYGKRGMKYADKAITLEPNKPNGYYWYGMNVGIYSDAVSILTALREGLKDKTQENFEKAYKMDKTFDEAGTIVALGRFWQVVPWPFRDKDKAMELYREYQKTKYYDTHVECRIYMAQLLADRWGSKYKKEARKLANEVLKMTNEKYWQNEAKKVLADL